MNLLNPAYMPLDEVRLARDAEIVRRAVKEPYKVIGNEFGLSASRVKAIVQKAKGEPNIIKDAYEQTDFLHGVGV